MIKLLAHWGECCGRNNHNSDKKPAQCCGSPVWLQTSVAQKISATQVLHVTAGDLLEAKAFTSAILFMLLTTKYRSGR